MKNTIPAQPYGKPRAVSYARAYNFARRQTICRRRGDAAVVYYDCLHLSVDVRWYMIPWYVHKEQTSCTARVKTPVNNKYIYIYILYTINSTEL